MAGAIFFWQSSQSRVSGGVQCQVQWRKTQCEGHPGWKVETKAFVLQWESEQQQQKDALFSEEEWLFHPGSQIAHLYSSIGGNHQPRVILKSNQGCTNLEGGNP